MEKIKKSFHSSLLTPNSSLKIALQMTGITKSFGSVLANDHVNLELYKGEILSLLGENGSGKTTLMNMISGIYFPDEGRIFINGEEAVISSPEDASDYGIGMVHQHFKLVDIFTAAENIVLGVKEDKVFNLKQVNLKVSEIAERYGFHIDPAKKIYDMSVSEKQTVEIIKVLYRGADILILDEPTAVLTPQEIRQLFKILRKMKDDGKSVIIITHKLNEVLEVSDRVAILRKGKHIATVKTSETDEAELTEMMVGAKINLDIERPEPKNPELRLEIKNLSLCNSDGVQALKNISFDVRSGEILGIAGITGSGQRELLEAIAGLQTFEDGEIIFHNPKKDKPVTFFHKNLKRVEELCREHAFHDENGKEISFDGMTHKEIRDFVNSGKVLFKEDEIINLRHKTPLEIRELGIRLSFVPEDRLGMGLVGSMDITDNMMLRSYRKGHKYSGLLDRKTPHNLAEYIIKDLRISIPDENIPVQKLSGGNIQKVLVGREIAFTPKVFMAAYPVRGLDISSSYAIYDLLNQQKKKGIAVIYAGEDLDVLLALCDRIMVLNGGSVTGLLDAKNATKEEIGFLMTKTGNTEGGRNLEK